VLGCSTSASFSSQSGPANPGDNHGKPAQGGGPDNPGATPGNGNHPAPVPAVPGNPPAPCVPALNDVSTSLFGARVVIRLPKGIELVEQNPFLAVAAAPQSTTSCGGVARYVAVGFFEYPGSTPVTTVRDNLMQLRGIPADTIAWSDEGTRGRSYTAAYHAPVDPKTNAPETKGWLVLREAPNDKYAYFAMFEAEPAAFDGLKAVFQESGRRLLVKPRALQAPDVVEAAPNGKPPPVKPVTKPAK
jgi:hypothetical protein